jgi:hypothetical protein
MAYPTTKVEIAFADGPYIAAPTWTDVTTYVRNVSIRRGRTGDFEQFGPGSATVILDNRDERFNPLNTAGTYYGNLLPRRQIRITADTGSGYVAVFRGYVSGWPVSWSRYGADSTVAINCLDAMSLLADTNLVADWSYQTITTGMPVGAPNSYYRLQQPTSSTFFDDTMNAAVPYYYLRQSAGAFSYLKTTPLTPGLPAGGTNFQPGNSWTATGIVPGAFALGACAISLWWRASRVGVASTPFTLTNKLIQLEGVVTTSGTLRLRAYNSSQYWESTSTIATLADGEAHHIFAQTDAGGSFWIFIDGQSCAGAVTNVASGRTFAASPVTLTLSDDIMSEVAYWAKNTGSAPFNFAFGPTTAAVQSLYASGKPYFVETTAARATRILQTTALDSSMYSITAAPEGTVAEISVGGSVIPELQKTADSEGGDLYVSKSGVLTFTERSYAPRQGASTSAATFTDTGTNNPYGGQLDVQIDADNISNDITVTFSNGGNVRTTSTTSQTANGVASATIDTYLSSTDEANTLATFESIIRATVKPQVSAIEVSATSSSAHWATILSLELLSPITITRTPSTGSVFTQKMLINSITHDITPNAWTTMIEGSARYVGYFVLDYSSLDGPDILI